MSCLQVFAGLALGLLGSSAAWAGPPDPAPPDPAPPDASDAAELEDAPQPGSETAPPSETSEPELEPEAPPPLSPEIAGPPAVDTVLPSGLRLLAAQDTTLPVAAIVLAVETGTEDDPTEYPGLVHALAYQLLQGNRELAPGGVAQIAHNGGGMTSLAIGPAQVRYESLVPMSLLQEVVWAETQRLRAPNVSAELWTQALSWARRDAPRKWALSREALAAVHGAPGLAHDGRRTSPALASLSERVVGAAIADRFTYDRATLVVVAAQPPEKTLQMVQALMGDLPPRQRSVPARAPRRDSASDAPRKVSHPNADGNTFAWAVDPDPVSAVWAQVWCRTINRQRRTADEPTKARVRCTLDQDPRRGTVVLRTIGTDDPLALVRQRVTRIADGADARLLERQRRVVEADLRQDLRMPLPLARRLATVGPHNPGEESSPNPSNPTEASVMRGVHILSGLASLVPDAGLMPTLAESFGLRRAVQLVP